MSLERNPSAFSRSHPWPTPALADALVALVALVVYGRALGNGYALDDIPIITHPLIQALHTLPAALASPWWYSTHHLYRPLTLLFLGVEHLAGGRSPLAPHAANLILYALTAILLRRLYARFVAPGAALAGALLFAVLPVHAEAVAAVVGQAELISALALVALLLLVTADAPPTLRRLGVAALLAAAAIAGKEGGVTAPFLVLAAAWTLARQRRHATRWATAALVGVCTLLAARLMVLGTFGGDAANPVFRETSVWTQWQIATAMLPRAALMMVLPIPPAIDYVPMLAAIQHPAWGPIALGLVLVGLVLVALMRHRETPTAVTFGIILTAALIAPTANLLFPSGVVLDARTLYAPSIGTGLLMAVLLTTFHRRAPRATPALVATFALAAAATAWREAPVWHDTQTVVATMVTRHPDDYRGYLHLAEMARARGRPADAVTYYRAAIARYPAEPEMLTDAATIALHLHDTTTAVSWLQAAVVGSPRAARARTRLYGVWRAQGKLADARRLLLDGLAQEPSQRTWSALLTEPDAGHSPIAAGAP
ncbi:MAG: tetratricopeptide repeat protein [Gemmatimonadaceae bacterium]